MYSTFASKYPPSDLQQRWNGYLGQPNGYAAPRQMQVKVEELEEGEILEDIKQEEDLEESECSFCASRHNEENMSVVSAPVPSSVVYPEKAGTDVFSCKEEERTDFFVCGINGCEEVLPREFYKVRQHMRYSEKHLGIYPSAEAKAKAPIPFCPVPNCNFENESAMRVAEHVCSSKHFNVVLRCYAKNCNKTYDGRQCSLKRHRDGENGKPGKCRSCEGCDGYFKNGEERTEHELKCEAALRARMARFRKREDEDREGREQVRQFRYRKGWAIH